MLVMASQVYSSASETIYTQVFNNASWHFQPASLWLRAIPGISVLGEGGDPCIAGNGPSEDHKTVIFPRDGFPFH